MLQLLEKAAEEALQELTAAEKASLEATAAAVKARDEHERLAAAVAALKGGAASPHPGEKPVKREKKEKGPLADVKCAGCGAVGSLFDTEHVTRDGRRIRTRSCGSCKNEQLLLS
jgi:ribosomal protein S27E